MIQTDAMIVGFTKTKCIRQLQSCFTFKCLLLQNL